MSQDKDKNLDLDTNPEFEAYVTLFKANHSEPKFPEFSSEWLTRRPKILCEVTTMNNYSKNNNTISKTDGSQIKRFFQPKIYLTAAATVIAVLGVALLVFRSPAVKAPNVSHTGNLKAIVVYVKGDVSRLKSDGSSQKLHTGDILGAGTEIETKDDSLIDITFAGGTMVRLRENTKATLATPVEPNKGIYIEQESGATLHLVRKLESNTEYGSISPTAIASVRGTIYEFNVENFNVENKATTVTVAEGMVEATGLKGKTETHIIEADQKIRLSDEHDEPVRRESKDLEIEAKDMQKNATAFNELMSLSDDLENASTEEELKRIYQSEIEFITLRDGRVLRGVVVSQASGKMLVQTINGSHFIDADAVQSIRYVDTK